MNASLDSTRTLARETTAAFRMAFGGEPAALAAAPGRVNLIGDHTDYNDGFVLPMALDRVTVVAGAVSPSERSRVVSVELHAREAGGFTRYVDAVAEELRALGWQIPIVDAVIHSSVPIGAGLSSSAALTVATATMFEALVGQSLSPMEKAQLCQRAEHRVGTPCGIMDVFMATHGRAGCALLLDCRSLAFEAIALPTEDVSWLIVNTGVHHALTDGAYAERRACCERAAQSLGRIALRDIAHDELALLRGRELKCARHVVTENARTLRAAEALRDNEMESFGRLMFESHDSLATDFGVSCPELDHVVDAVRHGARQGVFGARMTGAGFGGCVIVLCQRTATEQVMSGIVQAFGETFGRLPSVFRAVAGSSACQLGRSGGG